MKNSIFIILGTSISMLSCKNQESKNETQADSAVISSYDSANVAAAPPAGQQADSAAYRKGADTLKQPMKQSDSIVR